MRAYLAGPINGCTNDEANTWRDQVKARLGEDACIDPMRRDYRGRGDECVQDIVRGDIRDIKDSTVLIANCWQPSFGTAMELWFAGGGHTGAGSTAFSRPIVAIVPPGQPVSPWLRHVATEIVHDIESAILAAIRLG